MSSNSKKPGVATTIYLVLVFVVLYAPIIYLAYYSFNSGGSMHSFEGFTLEWYGEVFQDTRLVIILLNTLAIALFSAAISTMIGALGAIAITHVKSKQFRSALLTLNNVLIVSPDVIIGASFLILFAAMGLKLGFTSVLISHIAFSVPIVVLMVLPKLQEMKARLRAWDPVAEGKFKEIHPELECEQDLYECAKISDAHNLACINVTYQGALGEGLNALTGSGFADAVGGGDVDSAVIIDVDLGVGLFL